MKRRLIEHALSILLVGAAFFAVNFWYGESRKAERSRVESIVAPYLAMDSVDFNRPMHREMFREAMRSFYPESPDRPDSLLDAIASYQRDQVTKRENKSGGAAGITMSDLTELAGMFVMFVAVFGACLLLTVLGGRTLAIYRYVLLRQGNSAPFARIVAALGGNKDRLPRGRALLKNIGQIAVTSALTAMAFSPAYVVAYAMKGRIDPGSIIILIPLAALTNGVMLQYAARFLEQLVAAGKSGFIETAAAKGLDTDWSWNVPGGVPRTILWRPLTTGTGHVFHHLYLQAWYQHLSALKEHASVLLSAIIITEMAVNIQGHMGYALLQNIYYRRYDLMAAIMFLMFLIVKFVELAADFRAERISRRYSNEN
jgi:hypothetical protein